MAEEQLDLEFSDDVRSNFAECPPAGIYRDIPFADYAGWKAINSGIVKWGHVSQRHMKAAFDGKIANEDTLSRKFGRAVHTRLLEPELFSERVLVSSPCSALLKSGDRKGERCGKAAGHRVQGGDWYCGTHKPDDAIQPEDFVTEAELQRIEAMATALHESPVTALLKAEGWSEASIVFKQDSLVLKGRLDRISQQAGMLLDLKKMRLGYGTMEDCRRAIDRYSWMNQMRLYSQGVK